MPDSQYHGLVATTDTATGRLCIGVLGDLGCRSTLVDKGVEALVVARSEPPVVVLIDVQLHDVPGRVAAAWFRTDPALSALPVVMVNASRAELPALAALRLDGTLLKPLQRAALHRVVEGLLSRSDTKPAA
jgi:two-component system, sensor histidine kinase and response regulator